MKAELKEAFRVYDKEAQVRGHSLMTSQKFDPTFKKFHFIPSLVNTVHASSHPRSSLCGVTSFLNDHKEEVPLNYSTLPIGVYLNQQTGAYKCIPMVKNNDKCLKIIKSTFFIMLSRILHSRMMKMIKNDQLLGLMQYIQYKKVILMIFQPFSSFPAM